MRGVDTGAAAACLLRALRMGRTIGAEEELRVAGGRRLDQRLAMLLAFEDREAIVMGTDAAQEERVAVHEQVVRSDGGGDVRPRHLDILYGVAGRDVLEHDFQLRE